MMSTTVPSSTGRCCGPRLAVLTLAAALPLVGAGCTNSATGGDGSASTVVQSCADVLAMPAVQAALAELTSNGLTFALPTGTTLPDLTGTYALVQTTTFDPDGADVGASVNGIVLLSGQANGRITREGFGGSIEQFVADGLQSHRDHNDPV